MAISLNVNVAFAALLCLSCPAFGANSVVEEAFKDAEIYPDIISSIPEDFIQVDFQVAVLLGNEFTPNETQFEPEIRFAPSDRNSSYTLVVADPDSPSRQNRENAFVRHWLVTNIPGSEFAAARGDVVTPYRGPNPPSGSGLHRYIFLVYRQTSTLNVSVSEERIKWPLEEFVRDEGLEGPVGGNFFVAKRE